MVKLVTVAAISGTWLIAYEVWKRVRQAESMRIVADEGARSRKYVTPLEWHRLDEVANGKPRRLLNVNNFGLEELEVRVPAARAGRRGGREGGTPSTWHLTAFHCRARRRRQTTRPACVVCCRGCALN